MLIATIILTIKKTPPYHLNYTKLFPLKKEN